MGIGITDRFYRTYTDGVGGYVPSALLADLLPQNVVHGAQELRTDLRVRLAVVSAE